MPTDDQLVAALRLGDRLEPRRRLQRLAASCARSAGRVRRRRRGGASPSRATSGTKLPSRRASTTTGGRSCSRGRARRSARAARARRLGRPRPLGCDARSTASSGEARVLQAELDAGAAHRRDPRPACRRRRATRRSCRRRGRARARPRGAAELGVAYRHERLDAAVEVALHQVGRADEVARRARRLARRARPRRRPPPRAASSRRATAEAVDARVLEEAADDRAHGDRLRQPGHARAQAAHARGR